MKKTNRTSTNIEDKRAESKASNMYKGKRFLGTDSVYRKDTTLVNARTNNNIKEAAEGSVRAKSRLLQGALKTKPGTSAMPLGPKPASEYTRYNLRKTQVTPGEWKTRSTLGG